LLKITKDDVAKVAISVTLSNGFLVGIIASCIMQVARAYYVFYRNASLYSACVNTLNCTGIRDNNLFLDVLTARRHAELYQNVCADAVREGLSLLTHSSVVI